MSLHWYFVIPAYAVGLSATLGVALWSWIAMGRAEARRDAVRRGSAGADRKLDR